MQKGLILLVFVSCEAVRLWWRGGNGGVVSSDKLPNLFVLDKIRQLVLLSPARSPSTLCAGCFTVPT